ncbi:MAG: hypothetical protein NC489_09080 [Ruminococcus flavefaciens]|nr:hypothetical protein [Ruminococcus flavefaciens]
MAGDVRAVAEKDLEFAFDESLAQLSAFPYVIRSMSGKTYPQTLNDEHLERLKDRKLGRVSPKSLIAFVNNYEMFIRPETYLRFAEEFIDTEYGLKLGFSREFFALLYYNCDHASASNNVPDPDAFPPMIELMNAYNPLNMRL